VNGSANFIETVQESILAIDNVSHRQHQISLTIPQCGAPSGWEEEIFRSELGLITGSGLSWNDSIRYVQLFNLTFFEFFRPVKVFRAFWISFIGARSCTYASTPYHSGQICLKISEEDDGVGDGGEDGRLRESASDMGKVGTITISNHASVYIAV